MNAQEQTFIDTLRAQGHKLTRARRALIYTLTNTSTPLSINELHARAAKIDAKIGLVTVYRSLDLFIELDLVRPVHLADNCHGYVLATPGHTHHLLCQCCHKVVEFSCCDLSAFVGDVERQTGYSITDHWLELKGICAECNATKAKCT